MQLTDHRKLTFSNTDQTSSDQWTSSIDGNVSLSFDDATFAGSGDSNNSTPPIRPGVGIISLAGDGTRVTTAAAANAGATTQTVTFSGSGIVFNNTYTGNVTQAFENCIISAEQTLAGTWTNSATINVEFNAQSQGQNGTLASNEFYVDGVSYATLKSTLASLASEEPNNTYLQQAVAHLPSTDPSGGAGFELPLAYARMLGLTTSTEAFDDEVILNTSYNWSYGQDVINTVEHEISEGGMGRIGGLGDQNSFWSTMDLFRYNSSGQADYTDGRDRKTTYFSYDGGSMLSSSAGLSFNNEYSGNTKVNGGDTADFTELDVFGTGETGEANTLSQTDLEIMAVLGWNPGSMPPGNGWNVIANGDFTDNGISDILWQNGNQVGVWLENSSLNPTWDLLSANTNGWSEVGTGDYTGNGVDDILWQDGSQVGVWLMNGSLNPAWDLLSSNTNGWSVAGSGDYTGDGVDDILWQDGSEVGVWLMNGNLSPAWRLLSANTNGWSVAGSGDYTGSGVDDILWQKGSEVGVWLMDGSLNPAWHLLSANTNGWSVVGSGDFTGNGVDDILWQNGSEVGVWLMNGNLTPTWHLLSSNTNGWSVVGTGDYTGNGVDDILWSNGNQVGIWLENSSLNPTWHALSASSNGWTAASAVITSTH